MGGSELGCALVGGNLLYLLPRDFSKWAKPEIFRSVRIGKPTGHPFLSRKCQGQNGKRQFSSECVRLIGSYRSVPCVTPIRRARALGFPKSTPLKRMLRVPHLP